MEPDLKAILESYRGDVEVIAQALKAEVAFFLHGINLEVLWVIHRWRLLLTLIKGIKYLLWDLIGSESLETKIVYCCPLCPNFGYFVPDCT
jgi:hypothetical protein